MLNPPGNGENAVLLEKLTDLQFLCGRILYPAFGIRCQGKRRYVSVSFLFKCFKRDRAIPFLLTHCQKFLWRIGKQRDVFEKEYVSVAAKRRFFRKRRKFFLGPISLFLDRVSRTI